MDQRKMDNQKPCERIDIYLYTHCEINKKDLVNASMCFFLVETTTPVNVYASSNREQVIANPVVADHYGEFPKLFIDKPYRVVIENRYGARIFQDEYE